MATLTLWAPDRRDIIWINCNPAAGAEIKDEHPLLVLSTRSFNRRTGIVIGLPMTHSAMHADNPFAMLYTHEGHAGYILTHQPKSFDWQQRQARAHHWGQLPDDLFQEARERLDEIIQLR
jgi:mRNA interferase MazF